jgi:threonine dehydratase
MRAFGAEIIEHGVDFDDARQRAAEIAQERGYEFVPSFHLNLVVGVATYARELFEANGDLDAVYAPIGLGSGICGLIRTRDLLGLRTDIVGVVSEPREFLPAILRGWEGGADQLRIHLRGWSSCSRA